MYVPESFQESDRSVAFDLIDAYGFATLVSWSTTEPLVNHVPLVLDRPASGQERLLGHVARANQHWRQFDGEKPVMAIFCGPHAYVSPSWYSNRPSVPTWNYAVVHVHGTAQLMDSEQTWAILCRLVEKYEARRRLPWKPDLSSDFVEKQLKAIVGFQIPIDNLEVKFKLGQNREAADREGALAGLEREDGSDSRELAAFARRYFRRKDGG
jgi:transcriptional regulator